MLKAFEKFALAASVPALDAHLENSRDILLTAPTGSGKSLFFPYYLSTKCTGKIIILEPRRLAALELAKYFSKCLGEQCGETAGYKFRMERAVGSKTRIIFQTYGNYLQELLHGEESADWILFDEFHERRADMDLLFAYFTARRNKPNAPRIAVLSAKLDIEPIEKALQTKCLEAGIPLYPVSILHQQQSAGSRLNDEIIKALRTLERNDVWQTTLVFLPGKGEIKSAHDAVDIAYGGKVKCLELFGGQSREIQDQIFEETLEPRIIFTTNIAETSLTVPNVTGVIDSGLERTTEFREEENLNILRLARISLQNAVQRTGRAGRTQKGVCIRLWNESEETRMPQGIVPEVFKMDLQRFLLCKAALEKNGEAGNSLSLLSSPEDSKIARASTSLTKLGFLENGSITELGIVALQTPLSDLKLAEAFLRLQSINTELLAIFAWLDAGNEFFAREKKSQNLQELANDMQSRRTPREVTYIFDKLTKFAQAKKYPNKKFNEILPELLTHFADNLATRAGNAFKFQNGTTLLADAENSKAILAFSLLRTGGGNKNELHTAAFLDIPESLLHSSEDTFEYELFWRSGQERYIGIEIRKNGDTEISRREVLPQEASPEVLAKLKELCAPTWLERFNRENLTHLYLDDDNRTLFVKMKLAAEHFPEFGLPTWTDEDMELIMDEFVSNVFMQRDLNPERYRNILIDYFGSSMMPWLKQNFPDSMVLPNGKKARYAYPEEGPVEISARLEDFMQNKGKHFIAQGKVPVRYDILAPNFRTVQKTWDLTGFWQNTYPEIRKELRGRYPKHPWPEKVEV